MNKTSWIAIVNRAAGGGKTERDWPEIEQYLRKYEINFETFFTDKRLHAAIIAKNKIKEGYSRIIVVGGDGTMNEVINGLFSQGVVQTTEVMLGMISVGTGNDWAKMFNIPSGYEDAVKTILQQRTFIQDAGLVQYTKNGKVWNRYFINIAGLGFGARVVERSNRMKEKGKSSSMLYLYNIFTSLLGYKAQKADIEIDGRSFKRKIFSVNVGICKFGGGGMIPVPHAVADDGLYSITLIKKIGKLNLLANMNRLYNGKILNHSKVENYMGQAIQIAGSSILQIETDGETLGQGPVSFQIIPKSVRVISGVLSA